MSDTKYYKNEYFIYKVVDGLCVECVDRRRNSVFPQSSWKYSEHHQTTESTEEEYKASCFEVCPVCSNRLRLRNPITGEHACDCGYVTWLVPQTTDQRAINIHLLKLIESCAKMIGELNDRVGVLEESKP